MQRDDYIRRMIIQFGQAWGQIFRLIRAKRHQEALEAINDTCGGILGLSFGSIANSTETELLARLTFDELPIAGRDKCIALASLLSQASEIYLGQNRLDESIDCDLKALYLMLTAVNQAPAFEIPKYAPDIEKLVRTLAAYHLPIPTAILLMHYYEHRGAYAKAEDVLFALLDTAPHEQGVIAAGTAFYERLQMLDDTALCAGGLSHSEVAAGLQELRRASPEQ